MRLLILLSLSIAAFSSVDSSINIPVDKHNKYTLGNQKNHPAIKLEGERYFASLAKISKTDIKESLTKIGYTASSVSLEDRGGELMYVVYAKDAEGKPYRLFVDAGNGALLLKEEA